MKPGDPDDSAGVIDITSDNEPESSPSRAKRQNSSSPTTGANVDMVDVQSGPPSSSTEADGDDDFDIDALVREEEERLAKMKYNSSAAVASSSAQPSASPTAPAPKATYINAGADDDEAMWDELNGLGDESFLPPPPPPAHTDDEDMWDVVREMDTATDVQQPYVPPPPPPPEPEHALPGLEAANENGGGAGAGDTSTVEESAGEDKELVGEEKEKRPTNDDDWDDMYL
jgi:replication fork protection complex subunit Csm3/Swi3